MGGRVRREDHLLHMRYMSLATLIETCHLLGGLIMNKLEYVPYRII